MVVDVIRLGPQSKMFREKDIESAADTVETLPVGLMSRGSQLLDYPRGNRVVGWYRGRGAFADGADRGPDKKRQLRKVAVGELWAHGEAVGDGVRANTQGVAGRNDPGLHELPELRRQRCLQGIG